MFYYVLFISLLLYFNRQYLCIDAVGWSEAAAVEKFADCVVICTQDQLHKVLY